MKNVFENIENNQKLDKAKEKLEQTKARYEAEIAKAKAEKRRVETHHKCIMGGLVVKYFAECYQYEEAELDKIIKAAVLSADCKNAVMKIKAENVEQNRSVSNEVHRESGKGQLQEM